MRRDIQISRRKEDEARDDENAHLRREMTVRGSELRDLVSMGVLDSADLVPLGGEAVELEGCTVRDKVRESRSASGSESALETRAHIRTANASFTKVSASQTSSEPSSPMGELLPGASYN